MRPIEHQPIEGVVGAEVDHLFGMMFEKQQ
jgi:hypothetical protein